VVFRCDVKSSFNDRGKAKQLLDFSECVNDGRKSLMDLDFLLEYENKFYILGESKLRGFKIPLGEEIALTRLVDDLSKVKPAILIIVDHDVLNPAEDIFLKDSTVRKFRYNCKWTDVQDKKISTKNFIAGFISFQNKQVRK